MVEGYGFGVMAWSRRIIGMSGYLAVALCMTAARADILTRTADAPFLLAQGKITQQQATANALKVLPGKVTDFTVERKRGKEVYVVEIVSDKDGSENDVLIDMTTGAVIGIDK